MLSVSFSMHFLIIPTFFFLIFFLPATEHVVNGGRFQKTIILVSLSFLSFLANLEASLVQTELFYTGDTS